MSCAVPILQPSQPGLRGSKLRRFAAAVTARRTRALGPGRLSLLARFLVYGFCRGPHRTACTSMHCAGIPYWTCTVSTPIGNSRPDCAPRATGPALDSKPHRGRHRPVLALFASDSQAGKWYKTGELGFRAWWRPFGIFPPASSPRICHGTRHRMGGMQSRVAGLEAVLGNLESEMRWTVRGAAVRVGWSGLARAGSLAKAARQAPKQHSPAPARASGRLPLPAPPSSGSPLPQWCPSASIHQSLTKVTIFPPPPLSPPPSLVDRRKDKSTRQLPRPLLSFSFPGTALFPPSEIPEIPIFFVSFFLHLAGCSLPFPTQPDVSPSVPHFSPNCLARCRLRRRRCCCSCPSRPRPHGCAPPATSTRPRRIPSPSRSNTPATAIPSPILTPIPTRLGPDHSTRRIRAPTLLDCPPPPTQAARLPKPP